MTMAQNDNMSLSVSRTIACGLVTLAYTAGRQFMCARFSAELLVQAAADGWRGRWAVQNWSAQTKLGMLSS